jgi:hypothetical protein
LESLKQQVEANSWPTYVKRLDWVMGESFADRFKSGNLRYNLAYFVSKPEEKECVVYLWRMENDYDLDLAIGYDDNDEWEWIQENHNAKTKLFVGSETLCNEWRNARRKFMDLIKAWEDGKTIQYKESGSGEWVDCDPLWYPESEYRVKPDMYVAYVDHYEPRLDFGLYAQWDKIQEYKGAKKKLFIGTKQQCEEWCDSHDKFAREILAWENGKEIQIRLNSDEWCDCVVSPEWCCDCEYRVKPNGLVWTDLKMGDILRRAGERPAPLGGRDEYVHIEERRMVTGIVDDPGTKRHVQLGGDWIDDDDLEKWSVEE